MVRLFAPHFRLLTVFAVAWRLRRRHNAICQQPPQHRCIRDRRRAERL